MAGMTVEKFQPLDEPRIEPSLNVLRHFAHDVTSIFKPLEFAARGRGPNGFLTFLAMVPVPQLKRAWLGRAPVDGP